MPSTSYLCPECSEPAPIREKNKLPGGKWRVRQCPKGHRFNTVKMTGEPEDFVRMLEPVSPEESGNPPGWNGCNNTCPKWRHCTEDKPLFLPCEVYIYPEENPEILDTNRLTEWPGMVLTVRE